ncbi:Uncharacterised protein [[Clostridium] sordellii]|uniref:hypothetical protein n=1 Tax=Paraclostridium sordellii TaxID=1505 RepID=UPI0005DC00FC|nr:hypothetical protein [Paeniclostridium sordellii]CEN23360.1 Uncharacterised protein [[Clostridium] sordellii] [Paeniclostridium sordellii]
MFKVEKIKEKLDLEVNDSNQCKGKWESSKGPWPWSKGDMCAEDCCRDCRENGKKTPYYSEYY